MEAKSIAADTVKRVLVVHGLPIPELDAATLEVRTL